MTSEKKAISIRIENSLTHIIIPCTNVPALQEQSEFFQEIINNMDDEEDTLTIQEDDPFEASSFLLHVIAYSQGNICPPIN